MSNEHEQGGDVVRSCAISQDLEAYPLLIQEMQQQFGENWGGLELEDAISVLNSSHAVHMESLVMAIGAKDEQHIDLIIEIVRVAKTKKTAHCFGNARFVRRGITWFDAQWRR